MILKMHYIFYAILIVGLINESLANCGNYVCHGSFICNINEEKSGVECFCKKDTVRSEDGNNIYCKRIENLNYDASKDSVLSDTVAQLSNVVTTKIETDSDVHDESNSESDETENRLDRNESIEVKTETETTEKKSEEKQITSEEHDSMEHSNEISGSNLNGQGNNEANNKLLTESTTKASNQHHITLPAASAIQKAPEIIIQSFDSESATVSKQTTNEQIVPVERNGETNDAMNGLDNNEVKTESTTKAAKLAIEIQYEELARKGKQITFKDDMPSEIGNDSRDAMNGLDNNEVKTESTTKAAKLAKQITFKDDMPPEIGNDSRDSNNEFDLNVLGNSETNTKFPIDSTTEVTSEYTSTQITSDTTESVPDLTEHKIIIPPINGPDNNRDEDKSESIAKPIKLTTEVKSDETAVEQENNSENIAGLTTEPHDDTSDTTTNIIAFNNFDAINNLYDFFDINFNCPNDQKKCQNICCTMQQICNDAGECVAEKEVNIKNAEANTKGSTIAYTIIGLGCIVAALGFALFKVHKLRRSGRFE